MPPVASRRSLFYPFLFFNSRYFLYDSFSDLSRFPIVLLQSYFPFISQLSGHRPRHDGSITQFLHFSLSELTVFYTISTGKIAHHCRAYNKVNTIILLYSLFCLSIRNSYSSPSTRKPASYSPLRNLLEISSKGA